ncbi:HAD-IIA family hydrolase [Caminibacter profundus]
MRGYFIDIQGTLIDDKDFLPLPGAIEFIKYLKQNNIPFILLTNNTKRESKEFIEYLKNLGFEFDNYLDPLMVLDEVIEGKIAPYGNEKFVNILSKNYEIDYKNPKNVVLGIKLYSNDEFAKIIENLLSGASLIGMHKTSLYNKGDKRYPGLGSILEMLRYATGKDYEIVGKPSIRFFKKASEVLGLNFDKITIISDDLYGDILPAMDLGIKGVLVLSGKIKNEKEITKKPDEIYTNIGECLKEGCRG